MNTDLHGSEESGDGREQFKRRRLISRQDPKRKRAPALWQVVVECRDEGEQREVYERMKAEGRKVRVMVL